MNTAVSNALNQYQTTGNSSVAYDDPHTLILRLLSGAVDRIAQAKGAMRQDRRQQQGELISKAIGIINGLSACLDHDQGGEVSENLEALYEYMNLRLLQANVGNDPDKLDEVSRLLNEIRSAWVQIKRVQDDQ